ncbi:MAG: DUF378 domain-containing protein [Candidatus Doudnabacteria bacterium]
MSGKHMGLHMLSFILLIIGGLNWGLAIWHKDIANWGLSMGVVNVIYALVALSAVYEAATHGSRCKECKGEM